jgi:RNA polymerase sigma factor (TIGR02999 family)
VCTSDDITVLLEQAASGQRTASAELLPLVYDQLRAIAQQRMAGERKGHTLQATALVHEAYVRLVGDGDVKWQGRAHFYSAAAEAMRRILVEHARAKSCVKRGGGGRGTTEKDAGPARRTPLEMSGIADLAAAENDEQILAFDDAFRRLSEYDERFAEVVRLRFYAGLSVEETANALGISERTVNNDWTYARAWLARHLRGAESEGAG